MRRERSPCALPEQELFLLSEAVRRTIAMGKALFTMLYDLVLCPGVPLSGPIISPLFAVHLFLTSTEFVGQSEGIHGVSGRVSPSFLKT